MINTRQILQEELDRFIDEVQQNMDQNRKNASGRARKGFYFELNGDDVATVYGVEYANSLQHGIRPRTWPRGLALQIQMWAKDKGITFGTPKEMIKFSNAVAYTIVNKGTVQARTGRYIDIYDSAFERCLDRTADRIGYYYLNRIVDSIGL